MPPVRRLTAILAADVAGYSRLMGADEEGTHERLKAHLRELIERFGIGCGTEETGCRPGALPDCWRLRKC
jgi:class 3 adenylate cyclase